MEVTISNMAWLPKDALGPVAVHLIKNNTTIIPKKMSFDKEQDDVRPIQLWRETATHIGIPRHYYRTMSASKNEVTYDLSEGQPLLKNVQTFALREYDQKPVMDVVYDSLTCGKWGTGLLEAYTAFGKTVCAIDLICRLEGTALVLVHSEALLFQWEERIKQFYPNCRIGRIQGDVCDYKDRDIVIGMIPSLMQEGEKYPEEMYRAFRTMIVDECHRVGAAAFSRAAPKFNPKYALGASGTIRRKDGCLNVIKWILGDVLIKADEKFRVNPIIYVRETPFRSVRKEYLKTDKKTGQTSNAIFDMNSFTRPTQLGFLQNSDARNKAIAADIVRSLRQGRNPLVMGERLAMFDSIRDHVDEFIKSDDSFPGIISHGFYVGGKDKKTKKEELEVASRCRIVYATMQCAREGVDIERLDTLFLVTPISDAEQTIGRVCRPKIKFVDGKPIVIPKEHAAMVVDYVDYEIDNFESSFNTRLTQYHRLGWKVIGLRHNHY